MREAWEIPFYLTIGGVAAVFFAFQFRPSTNPHDWARDEAEERFRRCVPCAWLGALLRPAPPPRGGLAALPLCFLTHLARTNTLHPTPPLRRADAGLPVVRGVNYAGVRFLKEAGSLTEAEAGALEEGADTATRMPARVVSQVAHP